MMGDIGVAFKGMRVNKMADIAKKRVFKVDGDIIEIDFNYNSDLNMYFGDYPDFSEDKRYTPNGHPWMNATNIDCSFSDEHYDDCGSCEHFLREFPNDIIGVCMKIKK